MSPDDFEKQLQQRPMRQVPVDWRAEILAAARAAANQSREQVREPSFLARIYEWLTVFPGLQPKALVVLAAAWVVILALHISTQDDAGVVTSKTSASQAVMAEVRAQRLFYAELIGSRDNREVQPPKPILPGPRSDWQSRTVTL